MGLSDTDSCNFGLFWACLQQLSILCHKTTIPRSKVGAERPPACKYVQNRCCMLKACSEIIHNQEVPEISVCFHSEASRWQPSAASVRNPNRRSRWISDVACNLRLSLLRSIMRGYEPKRLGSPSNLSELSNLGLREYRVETIS